MIGKINDIKIAKEDKLDDDVFLIVMFSLCYVSSCDLGFMIVLCFFV